MNKERIYLDVYEAFTGLKVSTIAEIPASFLDCFALIGAKQLRIVCIVHHRDRGATLGQISTRYGVTTATACRHSKESIAKTVIQ